MQHLIIEERDLTHATLQTVLRLANAGWTITVNDGKVHGLHIIAR